MYGGDGGKEIDGKKWETITGYKVCNDPVKVKKGDRLYMTSEYDVTRHRLRPNSGEHAMEAEGMALATFQFAKALA